MSTPVGLKNDEFGKMQADIHCMEKVYENVNMFAEHSTNILDVYCNMTDTRMPGPVLGTLNKAPNTLVCNSVQMVMAALWVRVLPALQIPTIVKNHKYEVATLGDGI